MPTPLTEKYINRLKSLIWREEAIVESLDYNRSLGYGGLRRGLSDLSLREILFLEMQRKNQKKY